MNIEKLLKEHISKAFQDKLLVADMNFIIPPGAIVGVVGPNGAGKTTLFQMITGKDSPDAGKIELGQTVKIAYVDQDRDSLDPEKTIYEVISKGNDKLLVGGREMKWTRRQAGDRQNYKLDQNEGRQNKNKIKCTRKENAPV
mgnify:CR=1 FL=1